VESPKGSGTFVKILGCVDIKKWPRDTDSLDATDQDSLSEEMLPSVIAKHGAASFTMNEFPNNALQKQLLRDPDTGEVRKYRIVENTGEWEQHDCFVKHDGGDRAIRALRKVSVTLQAVAEATYSS